jgi:4-amino-4-deoxy-L-arabinose transferase-like glycosyltransferase
MSVDDAAAATTRPVAPAQRQSEPTSTPRLRWPAVVVAALVLAGVGLRFVSVGPLWLDEAQSVAIASVPVHLLPDALRSDGAPPLWYFLLHLWIRGFGDSTYSVRLMAAVPAIAALPVAARLGRRLGGREVGRTTLILLATSPFAIRYGVEARMYSLILLLSLLAAHALLSVHRSARPGRAAVALGVLTCALLYTHYYAIWLGLVVGAAELWWAVRRRDTRSSWVVGALAAGAVGFVPWLPILRFQTAHTGAPWTAPPSFNAVLDTVAAWAGGVSPLARVAQLAMLALALLAVLGRRGASRTVVIGPPLAREPLRLLGVVFGVVLVAIVDAMITKQASVPRYTSVVLGLFVVVVAMGVQALPSQRSRRAVVAGLALIGLGVGAATVAQPRTQVGQVASVLAASSHPGDVVLYCPDQLGPSATRLLPPSLHLRQVVYPTFAAPTRVDWVDYAERMSLGDPTQVATDANQLAGHHTIWLEWAAGYRSVRSACGALLAQLGVIRGLPYIAVSRDARIAESMSLDEFPASRS